MKKIVFKSLFAIAIAILVSCGNNSKNETSTTSTEVEYGTNKVEVYYFHATRRCPTCNKIEEISQKFVENEYSNNDVVFYRINFDESANKEIAEKFDVRWSSLFIASGEEFTELTEIAFRNVMSNPVLLEEKIRETIDNYLNK